MTTFLSLPLVNPNDDNKITPVRKMNKNKPCWCRSGKKYKRCHFDRSTQPEINLFEMEADFFREFNKGYCSAPDDTQCSSTISKAHTVQRKGGLTAIADLGHVLTVKPLMKDLIGNQGAHAPRSIGIRKASVFPGFCSNHDTEIFKSVEGKSIQLNTEDAFLFAYRAISYALFSKQWQLRLATILRDMDKGKSFEIQVFIQQFLTEYISGIELALKDLKKCHKIFNERLVSKKRDNFHYMAVKFDKIIPIVACDCFYPETDFQGNRLQKLGSANANLEIITLTVTAFEDYSVAFFG